MVALLAAWQIAMPLHAATVYLDINGATAGSGITNGGAVTWDSSAIWTSTSDGTGTPTAWAANDLAVFSAGTDALLLPYTVTVDAGGQTVGGLTFEDTKVTLLGGPLTLSGAPVITLNHAGKTVIGSDLTANGLTITGLGNGYLSLTGTNNLTGTTTISGATVAVSSAAALGTGAISVTGNTTFGTVGGRLVLGGGWAGGITLANNLTLAGSGAGKGNVNGVGNGGNGNGAFVSIGNNTLTGTLTTSATSGADARIASSFGTLMIESSTVTLGAGRTTTFDGSGHIVIDTAISASTAALSKFGTGTLVLNNAANAFSGTVTIGSGLDIAAGFIRVGTGGALGTGTAIALNFGTLEVRAAAADAGTFSTKGISLTNSSTLFLDHAVGGADLNQTIDFGAYTSNTRSLTLNGRNGYGFSIGTVGTNIASTANRGFSVVTGSLNGLATIDGNFTIGESSGSRTFTFTTAGDAVFNGGVLKGSGSTGEAFTKNGTGTLTWNTTLVNASTMTNAVNISAGTLAISSLANSVALNSVINLGSTTAGVALNYVGVGETTAKVINLSGTTGPAFILANQATATSPLIISTNLTASGVGAKTLVLGGRDTQANEISGVIVDNGGTNTTAITKTGAGNWTLSGANTYTGATTVNRGTLILKATASGATDIVKANGAVIFNVDGTTAASGHLGTQSAGGIFQFDGFTGGSQEALGALTATAGHGKVVIGGTTTGSTLTFASLGTRGAGATLDLAPGGSSTVGFTAAVAGTNGIFNGATTYNGLDWVASSATGPFTAAAYGAYTTLVPAGSSTTNYRLTTGSVTLASNAAMNSLKLVGSAGTTTVNLTGVNPLTALGILFDNTSGSALIAGGTQIGAANSEVIVTTNGAGTAADVLTISSAISSGTGQLTKAGGGTLVLSGASAFTGNVHINEGTVRLSGATARIGTSQVAATVFNLRQGATFDLNGAGASATITIGALNGAGTITNSGGDSSTASTLVIGNGTTTTVAAAAFTGILQNGGTIPSPLLLNLTKAGTGIQYLTGANTYTGVTTINSGTLAATSLADGGIASSIGMSSNAAGNLVFNGGTLQYTGSNATVAQATQTPSVSTDRLFTLAAGGGTIDSSGTFGNSFLAAGVANHATLVFSNPGDIAFSGAGTRSLTLAGSSTGDNAMGLKLTDNAGSALSITKSGSGLWILRNTANDYSGATTIGQGVLQVGDDGSALTRTLPTTSALVLGAAATSGVLETSGLFVRDIAATATANKVFFGGVTGGGGFAASDAPLVVALGGVATPTQLTWGSGGFVPTGGNLVLSSSTALFDVDFKNDIDLGSVARTIQVDDNVNTSLDFATLSGVLSGTGGLVKTNSAGTLQLLGANTYTGDTTVNGGTLVVTSIGGSGSSSSLGGAAGTLKLGSAAISSTLSYVGAGETSSRAWQLTSATGMVSIDSSGFGALVLNGTFTNATAGAKTLNLTGNNSDLNEISSILTDSSSGALTVAKNGGGTWVLSGQNTYLGSTNLVYGLLGVGADSIGTAGSVTSGPLGRGTLAIGGSTSGGGLMAVGADRTVLNNITITSGTTSPVTYFNGDFSLTLAGSITGPTGGNSVMTNNIVAADKTVTLSGAILIGNATAQTITFNGPGTTIVSGAISNGAAGASAVTYAGTGAGSLTLSGANAYSGATTLTTGTLILRGSNSSSGNTTLTAGTLQLDSATNGGLASGTLTLTAGTLQALNAARSITNNVSMVAVTVSGSQDLTITGTLTANTVAATAGSRTLTSSITGGGTLTLGNVDLGNETATTRTFGLAGTGNTTITGVIANGAVTSLPNNLSVTNTGVTTLAGANTYSGTTTLNAAAGTLRFQGSNNSAGATTLTTGTMQFDSATNGGLASGTLTLTAGTLQALTTGRSLTNNVLLTAVTVSGSQDLTFTGSFTNNTGSRTLTSSITGGGVLTLAGPVYLSESATGRTLTIAGTGSTTVSGAIDNSNGLGGTGNVIITNTGVTTFSGANVYSGTTTVSGGTLLVNSSVGAGLTTVNGGTTAQGTLGGTGTILGGVTLATSTATSFAQGATVAPGALGTAGTLTINTVGLTINNFSNLSFDLGTATTIGGGVNDLISTNILPVIAGSTRVNINTLGTLAPAGSIYTLINGYTGTIANPENLILNTVFTGVDGGVRTGFLSNTNGALQLVMGNAGITTAYWAGSIDGTWSTLTPGTAASNWRDAASGGSDIFGLPTATTDVHFYTTSPAAANLTTTLGGLFTIKTLNFDAASTSPVTIAGGTLTITPASTTTGITMNALAGNVTISSPLVLGAAQTWTVEGSGSVLTITGAISGGQPNSTQAAPASNTSLTIKGAGSVTFGSTANTFTGDIVVDGGGLNVDNDRDWGGATVASSTSKTVTLINGGRLNVISGTVNPGATTTTNYNLLQIGIGGGIVDSASGANLTLDDSGQLTGSGMLTKTGLGILTLRHQNTFAGEIDITAGLLQLQTTYTVGGLGLSSAKINIQSGAAFNLNGQNLAAETKPLTIAGAGQASSPVGAITNSSTTAASFGGPVTLAADSSVGGPNGLTLGGVIDDEGNDFGLTKVGAGATTLSGTANTFSGTLSINGGTLSVASLADTGAGSNGAGTIIFNNAGAAATLTYTGSGATLTRGVTLQGSGGGVVLNSSGTGALLYNGTFTNSTTGNTALTLGGTFAGVTNVLAGVLADNGASILSLTKAGLSTWTLSGANTFTGNVTMGTGSGNLIITNSSALGVGPKTVSLVDNTTGNSGSIQLDGTGGDITLASNIGWMTSSNTGIGGIVNIAGNNTIQGNFTLVTGGGSTRFTSLAGSLTLSGNLSANTTARFVVLDGPSTGTVSGIISDGSPTNTLGVQKVGTGAWTLTGANTYTVGTAIQNGSLRLAGADNRLLSTGAGNTNVVLLGSGTNSGQLILGGDFSGGTGVGTQRMQTLTQNSATSVLSISGTGLLNTVMGGSDGGTSAGTPANNSVLNLNIGSGFTNTYAGLIGWDGTGSVGFANNINLRKSGGGTLVISANLSNWTGTGTGGDLVADPTRPELILSGGVLRLTSTAVLNTVLRNTGGIIDDQGFTAGPNFFLVATGGLITLNSTTDTFASAGITSDSTGVVALNFNNSGVNGYNNSEMYLGAVGARVYSGSSFAVGGGSTYRLGGGAPWNAVATSVVGGSGGYLRVTSADVLTGANTVIIGDNGSYNGGTGLFGSNSSVEFTAAQNYTGFTILAGGSLIFSNINQLGSPAVAAGSIILDGGILRYSSVTTDVSSRLTIDSGGTIDTNGNNVTFASVIGNSDTGTSDATSHSSTNGAGGLTKIGAGTLTLTGNSTYTGTTTVSGGTLQLNRQTGSLNSSSNLTFGGGSTFRFDNTGATGTLSQTLGTLTFAAGDGVILSQRTVAQSTNLTFGSFVRMPGATGNITVGGTGATAAINKVILTGAAATGSIIDAGLYFGGTDFATYDSGGNIRALLATDTNGAAVAAGATMGSVAGKDVFLNGAITAQTSLAVNSLKIAGAFGLAIGSGQTLTVTSGGIIKTGTTATISGGTLATAGELIIRQSAAADAMTISSIINAGTGVAGNVALTKSGAGTLTLSTSTNVLNGQVVVNGGTLSIDAQARVGGSTGFTLDGGTLLMTGGANLTGVFTLGLNGGTIRHSSDGNQTIGTAGDVVQFVGLGARTLTLNGLDSRAKTYQFSLGDAGGPTSLTIAGVGDLTVIALNGANTYTGTTTINRGILRLNSAGALPGGLGGATLTSSNTGGGNLTFNGGAAAVRAILEINNTSGDIYRSVGTGFDQIQWLGNGGFSVSDATTRIVNLGGAGAQLTWGVGGFVPTGSQLQFSQGAANVTAAGTVDFRNAVELGSAARTVDVSQGTAIIDAIMAGNITAGAGGGLVKSGGGVLALSGTNNTGAITISVTGGNLYFANAGAVLGTSGSITITGGVSSVGVGGSTNPLAILGSRIVASSTGGIALDTDSNDTLDFSTFTALRLTAFNPANVVTYFGGSILPNGGTYRFGGNQFLAAASGLSSTLALTAKDILSGTRSVDIAPGILAILQPQSYTGGTVVNTVLAGGTSVVGVGTDAAFGTGTVTVGGANTVSFGPVNGDHVVPNRIVNTQTGTVTFVMGANQTSEGLANNANQGALTFTGTLDLAARATSSVLHSRTGHAVLLLGDVTNSTNGITLNGTTLGLFGIFANPANGGVAKTYSGATILGDNTTLVIDSDASLGTSGGLTLNSSTLRLQPGSGAVTLNRVVTFSADDSQAFNVGVGDSLTITGAINGSLVTTAVRTLTKTGAGMLVLQGKNGTYTGNAAFSNTLQIQSGRLQLDSTAFTAATDRFFSDSATLLPIVLGVASATQGGGATLEMVQAAANANALTQGFGNLTINQGSHSIAVTNNSTTQAATLNLGATFSRAALNGGTLNFVSTTVGGVNNIASTVANNASGILGGWATFNGLNWVTQSGGSLIAFSGYTALPTTGATSGHALLSSTGTTTLTASQTIDSLKLVPTSGTLTLAVGSTTLTVTSGGVIFDNTNGSATISGTGQIGATGSEVIFHTAGSGAATNKLTVNATLKGAATVVTKSGAGTLVLAGANTYTGALIINAGTVEYSNATASNNLGNPTAGAANIILNGGTLSYTATGSNTLAYGITINGYSTINVANAGGVLVHNPAAFGITGVSGLTALLQKTGPGALTIQGGLNNANLGVLVAEGILNLSKTGTFLAVGETTNSNGIPYAALIVNNGAGAVITGAGTDQIGNASSVVVQGTGYLDVNGSATTSTAESFDGLAGNGVVRNTGSLPFTLTLGSNNSSGISAYTAGAAAAGVNTTGLNHFAGVIQGNIALTKTGSGTQILSGQNTYTGITTISAGTLQLGIANALPSGAGKGNVLIIGNNSGIGAGGASNVLAPGTLNMGGFDQTLNGLDSTTGGFVTNNPSAAASSTNTLTVGSGNASGSFNGVIMDGYSVGANSSTATPLAYTGKIDLVKTGTGTQVLSGQNTYTGVTTLNDGVLNVGSAENAGASGPLGNHAANAANTIVFGGGTLQYSAANQFDYSGRFSTAAGQNVRVDTNSQNVTFASNLVSAGGTVTKLGAGTLTLAGSSTYSGQTSITEGKVSVSSSANLGDASATNTIALSNGATLQGTASFDTGASRTVALGSGGGTLEATGTASMTVSGVISGPVDNGLTKTGTGTVVLTGANTYSGGTIVSAGTLEVSNASGSGTGTGSVIIGSTATLSGSGTIGGSVILGAGATLAPGEGSTDTSNKTLTFTAATTSVTAANTAQIHLGITTASTTDTAFASWFQTNNGTAAAYVSTLAGGIGEAGWNATPAVGHHDFISAAGTLILGDASTNDKRIVVSLNNATDLTYGSVFNLLDWSTLTTKDGTSLSAMSSGFFDVANNLDLPSLGLSGLAFDTTLFDAYGIIVVVPEPSRMMFFLLGLFCLVSRRRARTL